MTGDCRWEGVNFASKYRCSSLTCQVSPLFGQQPLQIFFRDKKCKKHDVSEECQVLITLLFVAALVGPFEPHVSTRTDFSLSHGRLKEPSQSMTRWCIHLH